MPSVRLLSFTAVVLTAVVVLAFAATSLATTGPGSRVDIYVDIWDHKFIVDYQTQSDYMGGTEMYETNPDEIVRGEVARFDLWNEGTKARNFTVFGKKIKGLKPGHRASIVVPLVKRGSFPYKITGVKGTKTLKGVFLVN